jgi:hypothetical protein
MTFSAHTGVDIILLQLIERADMELSAEWAVFEIGRELIESSRHIAMESHPLRFVYAH